MNAEYAEGDEENGATNRKDKGDECLAPEGERTEERVVIKIERVFMRGFCGATWRKAYHCKGGYEGKKGTGKKEIEKTDGEESYG